MRKFGYSLQGKLAIVSKLLWRGQRVSAILCAVSLDGVLDCYTTIDTIKADTFKDFVTDSLAGKL